MEHVHRILQEKRGPGKLQYPILGCHPREYVQDSRIPEAWKTSYCPMPRQLKIYSETNNIDGCYSLLYVRNLMAT